MNVLILHGLGGYSGVHWQQWLHDKLVEARHSVIMPDLPNPDHPDRSVWANLVRDLLKDLDLQDVVIVAHSLSVITSLDVIESLESPIKGLISVSGFSKDTGAEINSYFIKEKAVDFSKIRKNIDKSFVLYGDDDPYLSQEILRALAEDLGVSPTIYSEGGHLNSDSGYTTFPDILDIIRKLQLSVPR
jgi:predicted alpha/beta hydrolase family esterase